MPSKGPVVLTRNIRSQSASSTSSSRARCVRPALLTNPCTLAVPLLQLGGERRPAVGIGDVQRPADDRVAVGVEVVGRVDDVGGDDRRSFGGQGAGLGGTLPTRRAGDDDDLPGHAACRHVRAPVLDFNWVSGWRG